MNVAAILSVKGSQVHTTWPWTTVREVVRRLAGPPPIGALVVLDEQREVVGMISERDIIRSMARWTDGSDPYPIERTVAEVMSHRPPTCSPDDSVTALMRQMTSTRCRHLPVLDHGELVGLISIGDVVLHRVREITLESDVLRDLYVSRR
jgi:CBS domain-containing protein